MSSPGEPPNPWSREAQSGQWSPEPPAGAQSGQWPAPGGYQPPPYFPAAPPSPPRRRRPAALWVAFGVLMALVIGAAIWGAVAETRSHNSAAPPATGAGQSAITEGATTVVTASDRKSQLTVPTSWKDLPKAYHNELAVIQLGDLRREQYVLVITMDQNDFEDFDAFAEATIDGVKHVLTGATVGQQRNLTVGGLSATQYEITGKAEGVNVVFWYTLVAGKNAFYQVVAWTLPSKRSEAEPAIAEVISSFRELGPA